jgi:hypothetical protein
MCMCMCICMCMCVSYMCVYIYIYMYICVCVYIYTNTRTHIHTYTFISLHKCEEEGDDEPRYACISMFAYTHTRTKIHAHFTNTVSQDTNFTITYTYTQENPCTCHQPSLTNLSHPPTQPNVSCYQACRSLVKNQEQTFRYRLYACLCPVQETFLFLKATRRATMVMAAAAAHVTLATTNTLTTTDTIIHTGDVMVWMSLSRMVLGLGRRYLRKGWMLTVRSCLTVQRSRVKPWLTWRYVCMCVCV